MRVQFDGRDVVRPLGPTIELDIIILPTAPGVCWPRHEGIHMAGIAPPEYTQIPNEILDNMDSMKESEFRVLLAVCRQTFGWHRQSEILSLSQLVKMTGLSRPAVSTGIQAGITRGLLQRTEVSTKVGTQAWSYRLLVNLPKREPPPPGNVVDQVTVLPSQLDVPDTSIPRKPSYGDPGNVVDPPPGNVVSTQKKELKKLKETDRSIARDEERDVGSDRIGSVGSLNLCPGGTENDGGSVGSDRSVCEKLRAIGLGARQARNVLAKWPRTLGVSVDAWAAWIACHQHGEDDIANAVAYAYGGLMAGNLPDQPDDPEELLAEQRKRDNAAQAREAARFDRPPLPGAEPAPRSPPVIPIPENAIDPAEFRAAILRMREASMMPGSARPANAYQTGGPDE